MRCWNKGVGIQHVVRHGFVIVISYFAANGRKGCFGIQIRKIEPYMRTDDHFRSYYLTAVLSVLHLLL